MYLIKWKDYEEQTWEPEENVVNVEIWWKSFGRLPSKAFHCGVLLSCLSPGLIPYCVLIAMMLHIVRMMARTR